AGKVQFLAGLWGPGEDVNDVWVLYINTADELVFEVNGANTNLKSADNTRAGVSFSSYYDAWHHVAAVFDGAASSVTIYIDGKLEATETNTEYPVSRLRDLANDELPIQIGRTNALTNNPDLNRTFKGQLDEIRIWNKTFSESEIFCQKDMSLEGNEDGMLLYYRCNEEPWNFDLCDATDNGNTGLARSGAKCTSSDRTYTKTVNVTPMNVSLPIKDTIKCVNSKTYRFSVVNTSPCAKNVRIRIRDVHKDKFTISPNNTLLLEQNIPQEFEITIDADFTGAITDRLDVYSFNRCRDWNTWSVNITRITELHYSTDGVDFGILKADCIENPWVDTVVTICNNSEEIQPPGPVTVNSLYTNDPNVFRVIPSETLPHTLQPGECMEATVRFIAGSESDIFEDTLYVESDDRCEQMYKIPLKGEVIEALAIQTRNGSDRIDTIKFETTCVNFISQAEEYLWENLTQENIFIDTIITPGHFISKSFKFPVLLEPETGYLPNYFRFLPESSGDFLDSAIFVVKTEDCTIHRKVYFKARGFFSDVDFLDTLVDFGDVMVGQESVRQVEVINKSPDPLKLSVYLKKGDAYFLRGAKILNLGPGQTGSVDLTFKPSEPLEYFDEICIFDQRCYESRCIPVRGRGYTETFLYEPYVMETGNVIGCQSSRDTLIITNNTGQPLTLSNFVLDDPSGKFSHVRTVVSGADFTLNDAFDLGAGDRALLIFDYIPDDVTLDRADRAYIRYETQDGEKFAGELLGTSLRPKIFVTANVDFGTVEAGDTRMDTMTVENVSVASIRLDSVTADEGFEILWPRDLPKQLAPGDSVMVIVRFAPTESKTYDGKLKAYSSEPCNVEESGDLLGEGEIIPLEMPLSVVSFGKIRPCDCEEREIQLINRSLVFDMNIDSIWIDDENITDAATEFFTWESYEYNSQGSVFPFSLSPMSTSILKVIYCPRVPSERDLLDHSARIHVKARGSGWSNEYNSYLSGIQALLTEPDRFNVYFPPTRVDTFAAPQYVEYSIPGLDVNPQRSKIRVDSITFIPDERVFTASDSDGRPFYIEYDSSETFNIEVDFKPRAVRYYKAKMALHISEPCVYVDSTVSVEGSGFAPAFELSFNFDRQRSRLDTFRVINCDTLRIPVYSNPDIPAEFVDITMRLKYDTTKLDYAGAESIYLQDYCDPYLPYIDADDSDSLGTLFTLKNFCEVDSVRPFLLAKFVPKVERDTFKIFIDSLFFDTEEVILYQLITQRDSALIIIQKPEFEVLNTMNFDSVRVLDCAEDT
ncbi:MAG: choice-of-anchor D domain-containing protein, partial [Bacteroidota bacterium]